MNRRERMFGPVFVFGRLVCFFPIAGPALKMLCAQPMEKKHCFADQPSPKERVHVHIVWIINQEAAVAGLRLDILSTSWWSTLWTYAQCAYNFCDSQEWCGSRAAVGCPQIVRYARVRVRVSLSHTHKHMDRTRAWALRPSFGPMCLCWVWE